MATAVKKEKDFDVVLTLTKDEAATVRSLCGLVEWSNGTQRSTHAQSVFDAIGMLGIQGVQVCVNKGNGNVRFLPEDLNA